MPLSKLSAIICISPLVGLLNSVRVRSSVAMAIESQKFSYSSYEKDTLIREKRICFFVLNEGRYLTRLVILLLDYIHKMSLYFQSKVLVKKSLGSFRDIDSKRIESV